MFIVKIPLLAGEVLNLFVCSVGLFQMRLRAEFAHGHHKVAREFSYNFILHGRTRFLGLLSGFS